MNIHRYYLFEMYHSYLVTVCLCPSYQKQILQIFFFCPMAVAVVVAVVAVAVMLLVDTSYVI